MGGLKLAEALVYDEVVPEAQRREIEAHLMRKWLGTAPKGYAGGMSAVETLNLAGGTVRVPENAALAVGKVTGETGLALSGSGAVVVKDMSRLEGALGVTNASLNLTGRVIPDASLLPTNGLFAHFDMAATNSLETYELNGTNFVTRWNDLTGRHYAVADPTNRPWILKADCNGLDTLCTGPFVKNTDTRNLPKAGWLNWDNKACRARTVIEVIGVHEGGNFLVAGHDSGGICVLHRGGAYSGGSYADAILATGRVEPGETLYSENAFYSIDGKKVAYTQGFSSPDYHSFAVRCDDTKNPNYFLIGQFGKERNYRWGGQRVCEVLAYDRCLTDDELSRLEAYLQKKWFGRFYEGFGDDGLPTLALGAGGQVDFGGEKRRTAVVTGSGTIANGDVRVTDCFAPEAGFAVEGTVTFVGTEGTVVAPVDEFVGGTEVVLAACTGFEGDPAAWRLVDRAGRELDADMLKARFLYKNGNLVLSLRGRGSLLIVR